MRPYGPARFDQWFDDRKPYDDRRARRQARLEWRREVRAWLSKGD